MSYPLDRNGLRRDPQTILTGPKGPEAWFYEEQSGISIITHGNMAITIPWRKLRASVRRKYGK